MSLKMELLENSPGLGCTGTFGLQRRLSVFELGERVLVSTCFSLQVDVIVTFKKTQRGAARLWRESVRIQTSWRNKHLQSDQVLIQSCSLTGAELRDDFDEPGVQFSPGPHRHSVVS